MYLNEKTFEKDFSEKEKRNSVPKIIFFWKRLLYLKENTFETTSVPNRKKVQIKYKQLLKKKMLLKKIHSVLSKWKKNSTSSKNDFWKRLMYLKENNFGKHWCT